MPSGIAGRRSKAYISVTPESQPRAGAQIGHPETVPTDDTPLWLFADQLGPAVYGGEHAHRDVVLIEATSALRKRRYHRQKLHLVLSALRHAARDLGDRASVEVDATLLPLAPEVAERLLAGVRAAGFEEAVVDPRGFRSGSMNEAL